MVKANLQCIESPETKVSASQGVLRRFVVLCTPNPSSDDAGRQLIGKRKEFSIQRCRPERSATSGSPPIKYRNKNTIICISQKCVCVFG